VELRFTATLGTGIDGTEIGEESPRPGFLAAPGTEAEMNATAENSRLAERFPEGEGWKTWAPFGFLLRRKLPRRPVAE
jgi:hypothetical protein